MLWLWRACFASSTARDRCIILARWACQPFSLCCSQLQVVSKLHQILKPFLLRRVKTDVETSLPGKMEVRSRN